MIKNFLQSFNILTDDEIEGFIQVSSPRYLKKSEYFIRNGETCKEVGFVLKGILRSFYVRDDGKEITYCITFPDNLTTAYSSFILSQSTEENIQAITNVELLMIPKVAIDRLALKHPNWVRLLKTIAEQQYIELEKRIFLLQKNDALQRYRNLIINHPEYIQHIPLQYLASYLGITQRHLSRIRKELAF